MRFGDTTRIGRPFAKDPSGVWFGGRYLMYYSVPSFADNRPDNGWGIGIAQSTNLVDWEKVGEMTAGAPYEAKGLCAPNAIVLKGRVHLFYQTYGNGPKDAICHAISSDGIHFERNASNPVFRPHGAWTCGRAIDAEIIPLGKKLMLYSATRDPEYKIQMLTAASAPLDSDFGSAAWTQLGDGPILKPELPWERKCIEAPAVVRHGKKLFMFYAGAYNNEPQQIGCAVSTDGIRWKRISNEPFLANGKPGEWNESESGHPGILQGPHGETYLLFQGNNDKGKTWFLSMVRIGWRNGMPVIQR